MRRPTRALLSVAAVAAVTLPVAACERFSSDCDPDNTCSIMIQGTDFNEFPLPYDASDGTEPDGAKDRIRLVSAKKGGEAVIQAGGKENTCTQGSSFTVVDTTITCDAVEDDKVELSTARG